MKLTLKAVSLLSLVALVGCGANKGGLTRTADGQLVSGIIGGKPVPANSQIAKSTVAVIDLKRGAICTASILNNEVVLTAAHCVKGGANEDYRIVFGPNILEKTGIKAVRKVVAKRYNGAWDQGELAPDDAKDLGDIGVIKFTGGLPAGYAPARLLSNTSLLKTDAVVTLAGYGLTDGVAKTGEGSLRYVEVKIQQGNFSKTEVLVDQSQGKGACHGDSGGPAFVQEKDGKLSLFGITSRGYNDKGDTCGVSAVYTNAIAQAAWVKAALASMSAAQKKTIAVANN